MKINGHKKQNPGWFKRGYDPRRHKFTQAECSRGFWAAIESVASRYPNAVNAGGHMIRNLLPTLISKKTAADKQQ